MTPEGIFENHEGFSIIQIFFEKYPKDGVKFLMRKFHKIF